MNIEVKKHPKQNFRKSKQNGERIIEDDQVGFCLSRNEDWLDNQNQQSI